MGALALALALSELLVGTLIGGGAASAQRPVRERQGEVSIDWTAGTMGAPGAAAGDLRAPSATVARVGAERRARLSARASLELGARELLLANGTRVGAVLDRDPAAARRFAQALSRTRARAIRYSTDGSVMLQEVLPLEAVRLAVVGASSPPPPGDLAVSAVIVDATGLDSASKAALAGPVLSLGLVAGSTRYAGPTVFYRARTGSKDPTKDAKRDSRLGPKTVHVRATAFTDGSLVLTSEPAGQAADLLVQARESRALLVVVLPEKKS